MKWGFPASCIFNEAGFILAVAADFASESHTASRKASVLPPGSGKRAWNFFHFPRPLTKMLPNVPATLSPEMLQRCVEKPEVKMSARLLAHKQSVVWTPRPSAGPSRHSRWLLIPVPRHRIP